MKKKVKKQSAWLFIPITDLGCGWKGEIDRLPANQTFDLVIGYPLGGTKPHHFPIKTGKKGMGLIALLGKIGQAYEKLYEDPVGNHIFGHGIDDLCLEGININFTAKTITLRVGS